MVIQHGIWSKLERLKSPISGCLTSWPNIKKIVCLKCCLLVFYATATKHFLIRLWCVQQVDFIWQPAMTSSMVGLRRSSKALPKAKLAPKKSHGHCLVICGWAGPLQLSESQWNHYIWKVCSANWWDAPKTATSAAGIGQQKKPDSSAQQLPATLCNQRFRSWMNWTMKFCLISHIQVLLLLSRVSRVRLCATP